VAMFAVLAAILLWVGGRKTPVDDASPGPGS
jgi:hypothetical protein